MVFHSCLVCYSILVMVWVAAFFFCYILQPPGVSTFCFMLGALLQHPIDGIGSGFLFRFATAFMCVHVLFLARSPATALWFSPESVGMLQHPCEGIDIVGFATASRVTFILRESQYHFFCHSPIVWSSDSCNGIAAAYIGMTGVLWGFCQSCAIASRPWACP